MKRSPYEILGLNKQGIEEATKKPYPKEVIKNAYRKRALQVHPDHRAGHIKAEEEFQVLVQAYEDLLDDKKRAVIDKNLKEHPEWFESEKHLFLLVDEDSEEYNALSGEKLALTVYKPKGINLSELILNANYSSTAIITLAKKNSKFAEAIFATSSILMHLSIMEQIELFVFYYCLQDKSPSVATISFQKSQGVRNFKKIFNDNEEYQYELVRFCLQHDSEETVNFFIEKNTDWLVSFLNESNLLLLATKFSYIVLSMLSIKLPSMRPVEVQQIINKYPHLKQNILEKISSLPDQTALLIKDYLEAHEAINHHNILPLNYFSLNYEKISHLKFEAEPLFSNEDPLFSILTFTCCLTNAFKENLENHLSLIEMEKLSEYFFIAFKLLNTLLNFLDNDSKNLEKIRSLEAMLNPHSMLILFKKFNKAHLISLLEDINLQSFKDYQPQVIDFFLLSFVENNKPYFLSLLLDHNKDALKFLQKNSLLWQILPEREPYKSYSQIIELCENKGILPNKLPQQVDFISSSNETTDHSSKVTDPLMSDDDDSTQEEQSSSTNDKTDITRTSSLNAKNDQEKKINELSPIEIYKSRGFFPECLTQIQTESTSVNYQLISDTLEANWHKLSEEQIEKFWSKFYFLFEQNIINDDQVLKQKFKNQLSNRLFRIHSWMYLRKEIKSWFLLFWFADDPDILDYYGGAAGLKEIAKNAFNHTQLNDESYNDIVYQKDLNFEPLKELRKKLMVYFFFEKSHITLKDLIEVKELDKLLSIYPKCSFLIFIKVITSRNFIKKIDSYQQLINFLKAIKNSGLITTDELLNKIVDLIFSSGLSEEIIYMVTGHLKNIQPIFLEAVLFLLQERAVTSLQKTFLPILILDKYKKFQEASLFKFFTVAQFYVKKNAEKLSSETLNQLVEHYGEKITPILIENELYARYLNQKKLEEVLAQVDAASNFYVEDFTEEQQVEELFDHFEKLLCAPLKHLTHHLECVKLYARIEPLQQRINHPNLSLLKHTYPKNFPDNLLLWATLFVIQTSKFDHLKKRVLEIIQASLQAIDPTHFNKVCAGIGNALINNKVQIEDLNTLEPSLYQHIIAWIMKHQLLDLTLNIVENNSQLLKTEVLEVLEVIEITELEPVCQAIYSKFHEIDSKQTIQGLYQKLGVSITDKIIKVLIDLDLILPQFCLFVHETLSNNFTELDSKWGVARRKKLVNLFALVNQEKSDDILPLMIKADEKQQENAVKMSISTVNNTSSIPIQQKLRLTPPISSKFDADLTKNDSSILANFFNPLLDQPKKFTRNLQTIIAIISMASLACLIGWAIAGAVNDPLAQSLGTQVSTWMGKQLTYLMNLMHLNISIAITDFPAEAYLGMSIAFSIVFLVIALTMVYQFCKPAQNGTICLDVYTITKKQKSDLSVMYIVGKSYGYPTSAQQFSVEDSDLDYSDSDSDNLQDDVRCTI